MANSSLQVHPTPPSPEPGAAVADLVPSRRQYLDLKAAHPGAILLYRLGDFYETFDDDAALVARAARITLTSRSFGRSGRVPMAGIPHHALNHYLGRLLAAGHTVAVAEQVSPAGRGLVERAVTRVLTPGTVAEAALLPAAENRYLAAVHRLGDRSGLAWFDASTGEFAVLETSGDAAVAGVGEELARISPAECLVPDDSDDDTRLPELPRGVHRTRLERWHFEPSRAEGALCRRFGVHSLAAYGCADLPAATGAAGAILAYLERTNAALLPLLTGLRTEAPDRFVGLDPATRRNLELTRSLGTGGSRGSLLGILDRTRTAMGARALRRLLVRPLRDLTEIDRRQTLVAALAASAAARSAIGSGLAAAGDLERLVGRILQGQVGPGEFLALAAALRVVPSINAELASLAAAQRSGALPTAAAAACADPGSAAPPTPLPLSPDDPGPAFAEARPDHCSPAGCFPIDPCPDTFDRLRAGVEADPDGGARVRPGFWPALDVALAAAGDTRHWLATLEHRERERTGIRSLKVGHTKVFGYYIEVTRPNLSLVPDDYRRKQTVAAGERYVTVPLKEAEARLLADDEEIAAREREALDRLRAGVAGDAARLVAAAAALAHLDALLALAEVAAQNRWVRPRLDQGDALLIEGGRHPVVEAGLAGESFIANDCRLVGGSDGPRQLVVTGPNMGGKSTFLRQTALIVLLAQIGSLVPAAGATIGLVDRIFTRVGAQDDLARGQSTFMVEMVETAAILHQATRRSLLVLDEVGRGTGTDDGLAIARAVLEDIHDRLGARALFATHYLELTSLAADLPGIANAHVAVLERDDRVVFLYALRPGPADRAYGVHVARLAGLPPWVADRAESILDAKVRQRLPVEPQFPPPSSPLAPTPIPPVSPPATEYPVHGSDGASPSPWIAADGPGPPYQLGLDGFPPVPAVPHRLAAELRGLDLATMTPKQALDWLHDQRSRLEPTERRLEDGL